MLAQTQQMKEKNPKSTRPSTAEMMNLAAAEICVHGN